jgi:site-specific recombinase XerD
MRTRAEEIVVAKEVLTEEEREHLLANYDDEIYADVRDRGIMATLLATGMRRSVVRTLPLSSYDHVTGEFSAVEKGEIVRLGKLSARSMRYVRAYLAVRPQKAKAG